MEKRVYIVFLVLLLGIAFFSQLSTAALPNSCSSSDQTILRLSHDTNAHGELATEPTAYTKSICFDDFFGTPASNTDRTCTGSNAIIALSQPTNAHAEIPFYDNYQYEVCYANLDCQIQQGGECFTDTGWVELFSLSSETNAHLGEAGEYNTKVCCKQEVVDNSNTCQITDAYWGTTPTTDKLSATEGDAVLFTIEGQQCDGVRLTVLVQENNQPYEKAFNEVYFQGDKATGIWTAEWLSDGLFGGDPEFEFRATQLNKASNSMKSSNQVGVIKGATECTITSAEWNRTEARAGEPVELIITGEQCGEGDQVDIIVYEDDSIGFFKRTTPVANDTLGNAFFGITESNKAYTTWIAEWDEERYNEKEPEFKFEATPVNNPGLTKTSSNELHTTSCFDDEQNGDETGIDCGGSCAQTCSEDGLNECLVTRMSWSTSQAVVGATVQLIIEATDQCIGEQITYTVYKDDAFSDTQISPSPSAIIYEGGEVAQNWVVKRASGNEDDDQALYFKVDIGDIDKSSKASDIAGEHKILTVPPAGEASCTGITQCGDYGSDQAACEATTCFSNCVFDTEEGICSIQEGEGIGPNGEVYSCRSIPIDKGDDCSDGILLVDQTHKFIWDGESYETIETLPPEVPEDIKQQEAKECFEKPGEIPYSCPEEIELPFFTWFNLLVSMLFIGICYVIFSKKGKSFLFSQ